MGRRKQHLEYRILEVQQDETGEVSLLPFGPVFDTRKSADAALRETQFRAGFTRLPLWISNRSRRSRSAASA